MGMVPPGRAALVLVLVAACHRGGTLSPVGDAAPVADAPAGGGADTAALAPAPDAPPPADAAATTLAETYARAGVVLGSCMPDDGINRNISYLWDPAPVPRFWGQVNRQAACLATSGGGCRAARDCLGYRITRDPGPCARTCKGNVFEACDDGFRVDIDCATVGLRCDPLAVCSETPATACDASTFQATCGADGRPLFCDDEATVRGPACGQFALACAAGHCTGTGEACAGGQTGPEGQVRPTGLACEGDTLVACVRDRQQRIACASQGPGFSCRSAQGHHFCGLAAACVPGTQGTPNACDGDVAVVCNAGRVDRVDCLSLGFVGCSVDRTKGYYGCIPPPDGGLIP